jgi:hypothetical protein
MHDFVCEKMRGLLYHNQALSISDKGQLFQLIHNQQARDLITEILQEIGTSFRVVKSHEVIKMIGEIVRFLLTLIVHENLREEHRLLYTIIDSSSQIYF